MSEENNYTQLTKLKEKYVLTCQTLLSIRSLERICLITALVSPALLVLPAEWAVRTTLWIWWAALLTTTVCEFYRRFLSARADTEYQQIETFEKGV